MRETRTSYSPAPFASCALSDPGSVRGNNEDEVYADDERGIYFVVDGMGGHAAGEEAARIAKARLKGRLERLTGTPEQRVREAIALANKDIYEAAEKRPEWRGMACVLTVALFEGDEATIGHVGDSRLYKITHWKLDKITKDHSPVGELEDRKELSEAQAMTHPRRNEVYRDVGSAPHDPDDAGFVDIYRIRVEPDSALLLCSDGLSDALPSDEILSVIRESAGDRPLVARRLIQRGIEDGKDNVSVVYIEGSTFATPQRPKPKAARPKAELPRRTADLAPAPRPEVIYLPEPQQPFFKRFGIPFICGMVVGAALFYGVQRGLPYLPAMNSPEQARKPQTIRVSPKEKDAVPTIAAALDSAQPGDTVELAPGVYKETVKLKSGIAIEGSGATIRPPDTPEGAVAISAEKVDHASIANIKVIGETGSTLLTGINLIDSEVSIRKVEIAGARWAGVEAAGTSTMKLEGSDIHDNAGPGVMIRGVAAGTLANNRITRNGRDKTSPKPGLQIMSPTQLNLTGNAFLNNGDKAIWQPYDPSDDLLHGNKFEGRPGKKTDVKVVPPETQR